MNGFDSIEHEDKYLHHSCDPSREGVMRTFRGSHNHYSPDGLKAEWTGKISLCGI